MSFSPTYSTGGVIDEVKKINLPEHIFPKLTEPFVKGFKLDIPARVGIYSETFTADHPLELLDVALACSGYGPSDYWELTIGGVKKFETIYTKEVAQHVNMGTALYSVSKIPAGTEILLEFHNQSASSKTVWFDLRFLK